MSIGVPLTIGPVTLASNAMLAPVANYCDLAFRIITRAWGGVGLACTDLLSPHGLLKGNQQSLDLARTHDLDQPIGMQLYGCDPDILCRGARWAVEHGATVIDINMGCPVDKVAKKNGGSLLLRDACATQRLTERVVRAVDEASGGRVPTTAKLRLGWDDDSIVAPQLARALERIGVAAITIHGRTTEQRFRGGVRIDGIAEVVAAVETIPVIGNGDIKSAGDCVAMIERTGCAGVMIGRGAFSRPWLFRDCWSLQTTGAVPDEPSERDKIESIRRYFELMIGFRSERYAMCHIRQRVSWFAKALGPCKGLRLRMQDAATPAEVHAALDGFLAGGLRSKPEQTPELATA
jgi:nifR3 family TIM-barrel protein